MKQFLTAYAFQLVTGLLLLVSLAVSRRKTAGALTIALKRFLKVLPAFITAILLTSTVLAFVTPDIIGSLLGSAADRWLGSLIAAGAGSVALMPGFVAYPLAGLLRDNGVPYMVISAFTTTLMMVGVVTFPVEKAYLGSRTALVRNVTAFLTALIVAAATALVFGELGI